MKNKSIFFDRDGVLNKLVKRNNGYYSPRLFKEFKIYTEAFELIQNLKKLGYLSICISNQPDIARKKMKREELDLMSKKLISELHINDIYYCMHDDKDKCNCRKPGIGLFTEAIKEWDIDIERSIFVGDTWRDALAGKNLEIKTLIIEKEYNSELNCEKKIKNLKELLTYI
jgi:D-glycero-D-manno-heptose 1,7-bisphosphate phosphatase